MGWELCCALALPWGDAKFLGFFCGLRSDSWWTESRNGGSLGLCPCSCVSCPPGQMCPKIGAWLFSSVS